jgi:hypothetical protein
MATFYLLSSSQPRDNVSTILSMLSQEQHQTNGERSVIGWGGSMDGIWSADILSEVGRRYGL